MHQLLYKVLSDVLIEMILYQHLQTVNIHHFHRQLYQFKLFSQIIRSKLFYQMLVCLISGILIPFYIGGCLTGKQRCIHIDQCGQFFLYDICVTFILLQ